MDYPESSAPDGRPAGDGSAARPARQRKTIEQRIAAEEEKLRKLRAQARSMERKARNHRLITSAATIEAEAGVELDERTARWLGRKLAAELANPDSDVARHFSRGGER